MEIKILGTGCAKCEKLYKLVTEVVSEIRADAKVEKVTDINKITMAGVMMTPALMVNDDVKITGRIPTKEQLKKILGYQK